jgi:Ribbon-helix-helix protein, copG family
MSTSSLKKVSLNFSSIDLHSESGMKDQIIYVRLTKDSVKKIDKIKRKIKLRTRSAMIRRLVEAALEKIDL